MLQLTFLGHQGWWVAAPQTNLLLRWAHPLRRPDATRRPYDR